jgi:DNA-binding transcriptional LysR family regulator
VALGFVDAATLRVSGSLRILSVTTTVALASTWLVPRLPRFAQLHPEIDMRFVASNHMVDLERENIDIALRYVPAGMAATSDDKLFDYVQFPVCSPALARDRQRSLRSAADLAKHVLIDFETVVYGRPWYDWAQWFGAKKLRGLHGTGWLRFSHYDQVIAAAVDGSGVAVGKLPHLTQHLRDRVLVAPLGDEGVATLGAFYLEVAPSAPPEVAAPFVAWLHAEAKRDQSESAGSTKARRAPRSARPAASSRKIR